MSKEIKEQFFNLFFVENVILSETKDDALH